MGFSPTENNWYLIGSVNPLGQMPFYVMPMFFCPHQSNPSQNYGYQQPQVQRYVPPKVKSRILAPGDERRTVDNPMYTAPSKEVPQYEVEFDRLIRARQIRIAELEAKTSKYARALTLIQNHDREWSAQLDDLAKDSDRQAHAAASDCLDLLMSSSGPLGALIDKLKEFGARKTLKGVLNEDGYRKIEAALRDLKHLSPGLKDAVNKALDAINGVLRSVKANDLGGWLKHVQELHEAVGYAERIRDEISEGKDKSALAVALQATRDVSAKAIIDISGHLLKEVGMTTVARGMTFANFASDYLYHSVEFRNDWIESNQLRQSMTNDFQAGETIRQLDGTAVDELKWQKGELSKLQGYKMDPSNEKANVESYLRNQTTQQTWLLNRYFERIGAYAQ